MQTIFLYLCYIVLILLFSTAYNTSLIYCFVIWCLHTNKRRPCSSTLSGHPSSSFFVFFCGRFSLLRWGPVFFLFLSCSSSPFALGFCLDQRTRKSNVLYSLFLQECFADMFCRNIEKTWVGEVGQHIRQGMATRREQKAKQKTTSTNSEKEEKK